jgi:hypothetical protein
MHRVKVFMFILPNMSLRVGEAIGYEPRDIGPIPLEKPVQ